MTTNSIKKSITIIAVIAAMAVAICLLMPAAISHAGGAAADGSKLMQSSSAYAASKGWVKSGGAWKYYKAGTAVKGWKKISGKWYYFASNGKMKTGWQKISGKKYYLGSNGKMKTGWQKISGKKYYFGTNGKMRTGWQKISGKKYYFGSNGKMRTGWQTVSSKKYYFGTDGKMVSGGYKTIGGVKYYFDANGVNKPVYMVTVEGGTVNGAKTVSYIAGTKVTIKANASPSGSYFKQWSTGHTATTFTYTIPTKHSTVTAQYYTIPVVKIDYRGEDENKTTTITFGQTWTSALQSGIGTVDYTVDMEESTVYLYDTNIGSNTGDFSSFLAVYVSKNTNKVCGWITNQPDLAQWDTTKIEQGQALSKYQPLINIALDLLSANDIAYEKIPYIYLYEKYESATTGITANYSTNTGKMAFGELLGPDAQCAWTSDVNQEIYAEAYTNAIRKIYGLTILTHSDDMYSSLGGVKDTADDWAAYGSLVVNGQLHVTSGILKPVLANLSASDRQTLVYNATGIQACAENGGNGNARKDVTGWYTDKNNYTVGSIGHRNAILSDYTINGYKVSTIAIGLSKNVSGASAMWIGLKPA
jgi:glucan-binding YG repeat protein